MILELAPWQHFALNNTYEHFALICGVATGKTFTGAHFAIKHFREHPDKMGFIGANTYDQLSQATLRELFYWLELYGWGFVADAKPPKEWGEVTKQFKSYKNILSVRNPETGKVTHAFLRVLAKGNPIRGIEFSWYWIDESRDTPLNTHDIIISRMRETSYRKGLVTTTSNSEDWVYQRFVKNNLGRMYGSMHIPTRMSVEYGIITESYYNMMRSSYSEQMAAQELDAQHVNVASGRAYYAFGKHNESYRAPWGDLHPNRAKPLIVGCDFNYSPAPCVWMIGQIGVNQEGRRHIHWFSEISQHETSSEDMTRTVINRFPGFVYQFFGDASGTKGSTSNQGYTDTVQISTTLQQAGCVFTLDFDQANPRVKDRVENMNRLAKNGLGEICMSYNPDQCPLFNTDVRVVGWKKTDGTNRRGKLDDGGDHNRTHATDGGGYAVWKLFPPIAVTHAATSIKREYADF